MSNEEEKLKSLQEMGYDREVSQMALEEAGGDVEKAIDIIHKNKADIIHKNAAKQEGEANPANQDDEDFVQVESRGDTEETTFDYVGKQPKEVLDHFGKKLLGEKHTNLRASFKAGYKGMQHSWRAAVDKMKELDEQHHISAKGSELIQTCDSKLKEFDEKHQWSQKTGAAAVGVQESATGAKESALKAYDSAKTSFRNLNTSSDPPGSLGTTETEETTSS